MKEERASKKQQELLQFIDSFIKGSGYGPSYREVMRALGYKSVSTVAVHIDQLIAKGYLEKKDHSARSLSIVTLRRNESTVTKSSPEKFSLDDLKKIAEKYEADGQSEKAKLLQDVALLLGEG